MPEDPIRAASGGVAELTIWGVPGRRVPSALVRMAMDGLTVRRSPGLRFAKLLGTASAQTFLPWDADPHHWALLTVWDDAQDAARFRSGRVHAAWQSISDERLTVSMAVMASRGRWARTEPFAGPHPRSGDQLAHPRSGPVTALATGPVAGPVAAITRARLRPSRMLNFWRAVPPIAEALGSAPGLLMAMSMGESPIGLSGTFSLWSSQAAMSDFAHRTPAHVSAIRRTRPERWYAEELFARLAVLSADGSYRGQQISIHADSPGWA